MPKSTPYVFCRYSLSIDEVPLSLDEQIRVLRNVRGRYVNYRRSDGIEDTFIMRPKTLKVDEYSTISWDIAQQVSQRTDYKYDRAKDEVDAKVSSVDYIKFCSFVAVPSLGAVAVTDSVSDSSFGAMSAIARFKGAFKSSVKGGVADFVLAATHADARKALRQWSISKFLFTVRPFNPHPKDPGRTLSEMFARDGIGRVQGHAIPKAGAKMKMTKQGYIEETLGLVEAGYGQFGVNGTTPAGREATLKKPMFSDDKGKNESLQAAPQQLRVNIEPQSSDTAERREAARALIEFYGNE